MNIDFRTFKMGFIPTNFLKCLALLLLVIVNLTSCQEKSIIDKDNNIVLMPRDDLNISVAIDGFDNSTFGNIAQLVSDNIFNNTDAEEDATMTTVSSEDEDVDTNPDSSWDPDMFTDPSNNDNSTSELEDIFNSRKNEHKDDMFPSSEIEDTVDGGVSTPSTTTSKMSFIQKVPRRTKPYPSAAKRRRRRRQVEVERTADEAVDNNKQHFLWIRAAPATSVSQIENAIEEESNSSTKIQDSVSKKPTHPEKSGNPELGWVSKVVSEAMTDFAPIQSNNTLCSNHSTLYKEHLKNLTLWAMQMLDSSTIIPSGLLAANVYHLGNFDECVNIILPSHGLQGKYCLASAVFSPTKEAYPFFFDGDHSKDFHKPEPFDFVWDTVKENLDPAKIPRNRFHWALCIPSSCSAEDLRSSLDQALKSLTPKYHVQFNVSVADTSCYVRPQDENLPTGFWVFTFISLLLISLVTLATVYDLGFLRKIESGNENTSNKSLRKWLIPFSALSNMEKLGSPNEQSEFSVIHALKAISMCQIIIGHRNMNVLGNVTLNPEFTEEKSSQLVWSYFNNGTLVVDTFSLIGGFLTFYFIFFELDKRKGKINYLVVYIYRFIRVTPVYAFIIFFYIYILPHMNDGPLWRDIIGRESNRCEKNWWTNILYFNNYYHENEQCMVQSWYLSCDFHFFIAGTLLTNLVWRYQNYAKLILTSVLLVFIVLPFCYVYQHNYWGHYRTYISQMRDPPSHPEFQSLYIKSHFRAIPYIIGIIYAYTYIRLKEIEYKFSNVSMWVISLTFFFIGHTPFLLAGLAYIPGRPYYVLEQALFNPLQRIVWAVCIGWILIGHGTTGFGALSKVFGHRVFVPFSRLTFCAYLIHVAVQITSIATMRTPTYVSYTGMILGVFGDLMFTFFCAFLLNIMIESPLDRFQKKVVKSLIGGFGPGSDKTKDTNVKEEIIEAVFQQGLTVNEKQSDSKGPITIISKGLDPVPIANALDPVPVSNKSGPVPVTKEDTKDNDNVVESNGEEHCHL